MHPQTTIDQLQRQLDLDYLLRGSVRRSADKVRISAQLHDLRDKSVLWSDTYDRKADDLLAVQEEVTQRVSQITRARAPSQRHSRLPPDILALRLLTMLT